MGFSKQGYEAVYDISILLGGEQIDLPIPGVPPFSRELILTFERGEACELSKFVLTSHSGTHIDVPSHFIPKGKSIDEYSIQEFILPAQIVDIKDKESVKPYELENLDIHAGDALLFKTDNSISGRCKSGIVSKNYVYVSLDAADFCISKKVSLIGIDYFAPERPGETIEAAPIHRRFLGNNILMLEGINLKMVPSGRYTLFCLPLKIKGADGSPVRAFLKP